MDILVAILDAIASMFVRNDEWSLGRIALLLFVVIALAMVGCWVYH